MLVYSFIFVKKFCDKLNLSNHDIIVSLKWSKATFDLFQMISCLIKYDKIY